MKVKGVGQGSRDPHDLCRGQVFPGSFGKHWRASSPGQPRAAVPTWTLEQHDFRMEKGAGNAGADGEKVALAAEDFDFASAGEFGKIHRPSMANARDHFVTGSDGWHRW